MQITKDIATNKDIIIKSNYLIESPCKLTITEQRIIYMILKQIDRNDEDFKEYKFEIDSFLKILDIQGTSKYTELKKITKKLRSRTFTIKIKDPNLIKKMNGDEIQTGWINEAIYKNGEGVIMFTLSHRLKPLLLQLKEYFTEFDINNLIRLSSTYSTQLYELLKQYQNINGKNKKHWERTFTLEDLRTKLSIDEKSYLRYANIKQRILRKAQIDIGEQTDLSFEYEEIKESRKVIAIKFNVILKDQSQNFIENKNKTKKNKKEPDNEIFNIANQFKKEFGAELHHDRITEMIKAKGLKKVKDRLLTYKNLINGKKTGNVAGLFYRSVMEEYSEVISLNKTSSLSNTCNFEQRKYEEEEFEKLFLNQEEG